MKPHPRIRKTIKWGGAAVTVVLVVLWVASGWVWVRHRAGRWERGIESGVAILASDSLSFGGYADGWNWGRCGDARMRGPWAWRWWGYFDDRLTSWQRGVPIWPLAAGCAVPTLLAWRLDVIARRRARAGRCPACSYDLAGLPRGPGAKCPECGASS